jgi:beta-glucosidase-like glycosyl hydrolase
MSGMPLGRLLMPALRCRGDVGFAHEDARMAEALELGVGGFILFGGTPDAVRALTDDLQRRSRVPLLIASDLERGAGQQVEGLVEIPPPLALAATGSEDVARWAGACTAREARRVGINWAFAPVADLDLLADNPIVQTRSFGRDPTAVARCVAAWVAGCESEGVLACAKHFPGHGRTTRDSHVEMPTVLADAATLLREDLLPFRAAIEAGVASVMTAHVQYPELDESGVPATLSPSVLRLLREELRFDGLAVTDALNMAGAQHGRSEADAAVAALRAGCDLLLYPDDPRGVVSALEAAISCGALGEARVAEAIRRIEEAVMRCAPVSERAGSVASAADAATAESVATRALQPLDARMPTLRAPIELVVLDDDIGGPFVPSPSDLVARSLASAGIPLGDGGSRVALVFNEPRAWKGRAGFGEAVQARFGEVAAADLVVLFAHPRHASALPGGAPTLLAWHRLAPMQRAAARWIAERIGAA